MKTISRSLVGLSAALATLYASGAAQALNLVTNGGFESTTNPFLGGPSNPGGDKMFFFNAAPTGWNSGPGGGFDYTYLCSPRTADGTVNGGANPFPVYGPFPYSSAGATSDAGGNFVQQDADPTFRVPISQMLTIPAAGDYVVRFDVAAGQQNHPNYTSPTTERWQVTLGSATPTPQFSFQFSLPGPLGAGGPAADVGPWRSEALTFHVPSAGQYLLQFAALGTPSGQPPVSFLDNVSVDAVPEPASLAVVGIGLLGSVAYRRCRRAKSAAM